MFLYMQHIKLGISSDINKNKVLLANIYQSTNMDGEFINQLNQLQVATRHSATFDYQQGYSDAIQDSGKATQESLLSFIFMSLILVIVFVRLVRPRGFREL